MRQRFFLFVISACYLRRCLASAYPWQSCNYFISTKPISQVLCSAVFLNTVNKENILLIRSLSKANYFLTYLYFESARNC